MKRKITQVFPECQLFTMSDLFMNKQRRRQRWQNFHPPTTTTAATADAANTKTSRTSRLTRASTPGAPTPQLLNGDYLDLDDDDEEDSDSDDVAVDEEADDQIPDDPLSNILSLQLRKPQHWKWELTTSKSCSNIALPRILLYDHKGNLLVDTPPGGGKDTREQIYKQEDYEKPSRPQEKSNKRPYNHHRAATTNLTHSVRKALEKEFDGLQIQEVTTLAPRSSQERRRQNSSYNTPSSASTNTTMRPHRSRKPIDFNIADLPDSSPRSSSLKGVRFNFDQEAKIPDFLPTPPSTTTPTSSSSGPREKRKYRRSHSTGRPSIRSESILERRSLQKGRLSSPESEGDERDNGATGPRYFLSTDEAGTLVVHQDSSSSHNSRRRRKPQKYSSPAESIKKSETPRHLSPAESIKKSETPRHLSPANTPLSEVSSVASSKERKRKQLPARRLLSEGNLLLNKRLSSSEEELTKPITIEKKEEPPAEPDPPVPGGGCNCIHHRRYRRNETKGRLPFVVSVYGTSDI